MSDSITSHPEDSVRSLISTTTTSNSILINKQNINKEELILERKEVIGYNVTVNFSKNPLVLLRGEGQYLYDEKDQKYLDCVNNVAHIGHAHPYFAEQLSKQVQLLYTNSRYLHPYLTNYTKRLLKTFPSSLSVMYWVNSGSEANDLALRLAREYTKKRGIITVETAYHGHLTNIIDISPYKYNRPNGTGKRSYIREAAVPDVYSGKYRGDINEENITNQYVQDIELLIKDLEYDEKIENSIRMKHQLLGKSTADDNNNNILPSSAASVTTTISDDTTVSSSDSGTNSPNYPRSTSISLGTHGEIFSSQVHNSISNSTTTTEYSKEELTYIKNHLIDDNLQAGCGAFIMESILSCGGQILPPKNYLRQVYQRIRQHGGVCIADEVQTGFGRSGSHFWAFQLQGDDVIPDIVTIGKPMGNGFPVAAVITTPEIARAFADTGIEYFNTYGGNPLATTAALATLDIIEKESLQENAYKIGQIFITELNKLMKKINERTQSSSPLCIGSIRGTGLMIGIEFIKNNIIREPDGDTAIYIKYEALKRYNILLSTDGMYDQVIKIKPPMCFTAENAYTVIQALETIMNDIIDQNGIVSK